MAFKRAGCDGVLTYFAPRVARLLAGATPRTDPPPKRPDLRNCDMPSRLRPSCSR